jgi:tripartite-type tricarboxylate transporter receptor subunit TctC
MKLPRRRFLQLATGAAALPAVSRALGAETYPSRPVRIVVAGAAGNTTDIFARLMGKWLSERLRQPFIIENRPGAGSNIGTETVVRASPDGYTLLWVGAPQVISPTLYDKLNFNFLSDIIPVASVLRVANVMEVNPTFPAKTVPEFITYARANPGKVNFASPGTGTSIHVSGELFKMLTNVNMVHVPYRGTAAALTDLMSGQVHVMFDNLPSSSEYIKDGRTRALAVTTTTRWEGLPDVPTVADFVPGFEASSIAGVGVPKNTPTEIIAKLSGEINAGLADPKLKLRITELGSTVLTLSSADYGKLLADEVEKWGKVVKYAGVKLD